MFAGIEAQVVEMTSVDRLGPNIRANTQNGMRGARIAILREVRDSGETRKVMVEFAKVVPPQPEP
ncbi:MAG TPA: DUF2470 domain-containing protein [Candidatus Sulfotelmatobacter sp.]|nr:DUF2470 domain-containing protein [Candidatus Sulfotelmatobacter sp.]